MSEKISTKLPVILLGVIIVVASFLMIGVARQESAIMDELAHIPAGYGYVKYFDFRLNPEHPPLLKVLAALPLLTMDLNFPTTHRSWTTDINGQWEVGAKFLYESGNDADKIVFVSRIIPILFTLLTIILIYLWSKELFSKWWALIPPFLFALSPTVLAHGHYVTTDIAAAFGIILATYLFLKFLLHSSRRNLIWAGIGLGIAELAKFSAVLLIPYFLIVLLFFIFSPLRRYSRRYYFGSAFLIFLIALGIIYAVYFIFTLNYPLEKQAADSKFILNSFSPRWLAGIPTVLAENRITRPLAEYILGFLMVMQRSAGGNTTYFLGVVSAAGSKLYFPLTFFLKESLPVIIFILTAFTVGVWKFFKSVKNKSRVKRFIDFLGTNFSEFAMFLFVAIYWVYTVRSPLNIGFRHLLPSIPFIYILSVIGLKTLRFNLKKWALGLLLIWFAAETFVAAPYFLSYFNQIGGGTRGGYRYVTDSNYDWGQDLKRLVAFTDEKRISKIAVDYFGGGNPQYYLNDKVEYWWSSKGNPKEMGVEWLAVSVNTLQGAFGRLYPGHQRSPNDEYRWLRDLRSQPTAFGEVPLPDFRVGTSIFVYHL